MNETTPIQATPASRAGRDLPIAIGSGILLAGGFLATAFWHPLAVSLLIMAFMLFGSIEASAQLRKVGVRAIVPVLLVTSIVITLATYRFGHAGMTVGVLVLFLGSALWMVLSRSRADALVKVGSTVLLGLWMPVMGAFAVLLVLTPDDGAAALVATVGAAAFADVGAYAVGSLWGRHKIAPRLSPNKTWEGFVGGIAVAAIVAAIAVPLFSSTYDAVEGVLIAIVAALAAFLGDLFESLIKRDLGIKDFGALLPGHGGVLDRMDGILFAMPMGYLTVVMLS